MLRVSTRGRYAVRIMLDLAARDQGENVPLRAIAEHQGITPKYLESITAQLLRAKLLISGRGKTGGYRLARPAEDYSIFEILEVAEGDLKPIPCMVGPENICPQKDICLSLPLWEGLNEVIEKYLQGVHLSDLLQKDGKKAAILCNERL